MKNLIYQYWDTQINKHDGGLNPPLKDVVPNGAKYSKSRVKEYADSIGAEHLFEIDPPYLYNFPQKSYYGALNPLYRPEFDKYDNILTLDADVYPVDNLVDNVFDVLEPDTDIAMAQEIFEPMRKTLENHRQFGHHADEQWCKAVETAYKIMLPRRADNILKVFNSGVVLWSRKGLEKAKEKFPSPVEYQDIISENRVKDFYSADQHFIHTSMIVSDLKFQELSTDWNTTVNYWNKDRSKILYDRTPMTKFVHLQMRGERWYKDDQTLHTILHLPVEHWGLNKTDVTKLMKPKLL
jgi:hypothetical protein